MRRLAILIFLVAMGCSNSGPSDSLAGPEAGMPGGVCYGNGTCNDGLVCESWVCVVQGKPDATDLEDGVLPDSVSPEFIPDDARQELDVPRNADATELGEVSDDLAPDCDCAWRVCGPDGCGGSCGECEGTDVCDAGACVHTEPVCSCVGKECGDDGCGVLCGNCAGGWQECVAGKCEAKPAPMIWAMIEGGTFNMGCSPGDTFCQDDEYPVHVVKVSSFEIQATEVTVWQWLSVFGGLPVCPGQSDAMDEPVGCVDWLDATVYCEAIGGRLPTEAEWEYAARGGTTTRFYCGDDPECVYGIGWGRWSMVSGPQPVMGKEPNAYGLYDMIGNVREWTADWYGPYIQDYQEDPVGPLSGEFRVSRGGSAVEGSVGAAGAISMGVSSRFPRPSKYDDPFEPFQVVNAYQGIRCVRDL